MFVKQCSIHRSRAKYIWKKKTNKLPDELVVYLFFLFGSLFVFFFHIYIYIIMINGSKISVHRFIATTLFRMIEG